MARDLPMRGRGASWNPPNRFETLHVERETWVDADDPAPRTRFFDDATRDIVSTNTSPDVPLDAGINPYRGCEHGCTYCFARPYHEYLGFSPGLDFETKIVVKRNAPALLRERLASPRWEPKPLMLSGATDPYQPVERRLRITRGVLEVLADFRNPVAVITKNHLVTRDVDVLAELASHGAVGVALSVTTLRNDLQRVMEPRTSIPARRLAAIEALAEAGVPVGVNVAPVIPGLTDHELPAILQAAADAGAVSAGYILLRLPGAVSDLFTAWLEQHFPDRKEKVLNRLRDIAAGETVSRCGSAGRAAGDAAGTHRDDLGASATGRSPAPATSDEAPLYDPRFGARKKGKGPWARQLRELFHVSARKAGLEVGGAGYLSTEAFRRPHGPGGQTDLFGG